MIKSEQDRLEPRPSATTSEPQNRPPSWKQIEELFSKASTVPEEDWDSFLEHATNDLTLRSEVASMLAAARGPGMAVERVLAEAPRVPPQATLTGSPNEPSTEGSALLPGQKIGSYRLVKLLGRGGMGEVFLAERHDEDFHRKVAIKLVGTDGSSVSSELTQRFHLERRLLAELQHPGIAQLLDAGQLADGRPYFVMEYLEGEPITDFCDRHQLDVRERMSLFESVCEVVQFAHSRLVIHRDLKPSNILVTRDENGVATVKLLDFGIAKLLEPTILGTAHAAEMLQTGTHQSPMTPLFAAPEQFAGESLTTATDVYALGVLFFLLLAGSPPHPRHGSAADYERAVRTSPPRRLTQLVVTTEPNQEDRNVATKRNSTPERLRKLLSGDLDQIGAMALHNDPHRRYGSAGQLGEDVRRWLDGKAVSAQDDTFRYRARVFVRRNRVAVLTAATVSLALIALTCFSVVQTMRAHSALSLAQSETERAQRVVDVLVNVFSTADPNAGPVGDEIPVGEFLDRVGNAVQSLGADPELQPQLLSVLGNIHIGRDEGERGLELLQQAADAHRARIGQAGASKPATALAEAEQLRLDHNVAKAVAAMDSERGRSLLRDSLGQHVQLHGERDLRSAKAAMDLASELDPKLGLPLMDEAIDNIRGALGPDHPQVAFALRQRSHHRRWVGMTEEAQVDSQSAVQILENALGRDHAETLRALSTHSAALPRHESLVVLRDLVTRQQRVFGSESGQVAESLNIIGEHLARMGEIDEAAEAFRQAVEIRKNLFGETARPVANPARNLAMLRAFQQEYADSRRWFETALAAGGSTGRGKTYLELQAITMHGRALRHGPSESTPQSPASVGSEATASQSTLETLVAQATEKIQILDRNRVGDRDPYPGRARGLFARLLMDAGLPARAFEEADAAATDLGSTHPAEHPLVVEAVFLRARAAFASAPSVENQDELRRALELYAGLPLHERLEVALANGMLR